VEKLWNNEALKQVRDKTLEALRVSQGGITIDLKDFGLFIYVMRELSEHGKTEIHVSVSISDFDATIRAMAKLNYGNPKAFMEEAVQASFGYQTLLIEKRFLATLSGGSVTSGNPPTDPESNLVYHWIYEDILDKG
jgi:hypothetical protein